MIETTPVLCSILALSNRVRASSFIKNTFPMASLNSELERVEGGFDAMPEQHFFALRPMVPNLKGLAILDNDGQERKDSNEGGLQIAYWRRYEEEE